ncbi:40128_t:CDS:2, partial [Gigaspora margarita]
MRKSTELLTTTQRRHQATTRRKTLKRLKKEQRQNEETPKRCHLLEKRSGSLINHYQRNKAITRISTKNINAENDTKQRRDEETPKRRHLLEKRSGSLITSLLAKQSYNEESAPKTSMWKSTELLTTTTTAIPSNDETKKHQNAATFLKKS